MFIGPIPSGQWVLHHCDTKSCVNPHHLFTGLPIDNSRDMVQKDRQAKGNKHGLAKLTEDEVLVIRGSSEMLKTLAERYGVSVSAVWSAKKGPNWKHIERAES
jgi:hypothetical protein